jgi:hypothetical protein
MVCCNKLKSAMVSAMAVTRIPVQFGSPKYRWGKSKNGVAW